MRTDLRIALEATLAMPCGTARTQARRDVALTEVIATIVDGEYAPETIALWMLAVVPEGVADE